MSGMKHGKSKLSPVERELHKIEREEEKLPEYDRFMGLDGFQMFVHAFRMNGMI